MKKMNLFVLGVFALALLISSVSALTVSSSTINLLNSNSTTITITSNNTLNETVHLNSNVSIIFSANDFVLTPSESKTISISVNRDNFTLGKDSTFNILASNGNVNATGIVTVKPAFCEYGKKGVQLSVSSITIDNLGNGDDSEWEFLDIVDLEISVENRDNDESISNIEAEIRIFDDAGVDVTNDFLDSSKDKILDYGKISKDTEESQIVQLKVDPTIPDGYYKIYIKTYEDGAEDEQCIEESDDFESTGNYLSFKVSAGDSEVGIDGLEYNALMSCGSSGTISFEFYNFDLADKEEDMRVNLYNKELGIDEVSEQFDLRKGKSVQLDFPIQIPKDIEEKEYKIQIYYEYDYDSDDETYGETEKSDVIKVKVEGNCKVIVPQISAVLDSEVMEGRELSIKAVLTNLDTSKRTYNVVVEGYDSWATLKDVDKEILIMDAGQSQEFNIQLNANKDSEGIQSLKISVFSNGELVLEQPLSVTVEKGKFDLGDFLNSNWKLIGLVILIILLIIAIIAIARRR